TIPMDIIKLMISYLSMFIYRYCEIPKEGGVEIQVDQLNVLVFDTLKSLPSLVFSTDDPRLYLLSENYNSDERCISHSELRSSSSSSNSELRSSSSSSNNGNEPIAIWTENIIATLTSNKNESAYTYLKTKCPINDPYRVVICKYYNSEYEYMRV